nr:response regulator [uncultured Caldimonas sp.]
MADTNDAAPAQTREAALFPQALIDGLPFLLWLEDAQGRRLQVNAGFARWLEDDVPREAANDIATLLTPEPPAPGHGGRSEVRYVDRHGETRWLEISRVGLQHGPAAGTVLCHARDVTPGKAVQQELTRTLAFVQGIIDAFPDFLFEGSAEGVYLNAWTKNPEMLAAAREHLIGHSLDEVLSPESAAIAKVAFAEAAATGLSLGHVIWIDTPVGRRWFELSVSKMPMGDGQAPHFITVSRDVTARLELQAALERQELQYRTLVENSPDLIARFDPSLHCLYANPAMALHAASPPAALLGQPPERLFGATAGATVRQRLEAVLGNGQPQQFELASSDAQDRTVHTLVNLTPEFDEPGRVSSVLMVGRDVSEQKRADDERRAREAAEAASRARSAFLATVSHEIRTPMNAILGMAHLALQGTLEPRQRHYVETVHRSAESLLGIINDILDFSKMEAGRLELEHIEFDLGDVLDSLARLVGMKAEEKGLELVFDPSPELPRRLIGDPSRLGQVLINLGNNAVKFTERGEVVVRLRVQERDPASAVLCFEVQDTGIGMDTRQLGQLFRPYTQGDASMSRRFGGTGLGLAISRQLVTLMGGELDVVSTPGRGSTFRFTVRVGLQPEPAPVGVDEDLRGTRVLVVDDNPTARHALASMLRALGLRSEAVDSGERALQRLAQYNREGDPCHVVLIDWKMPGMDGAECLRLLAGAGLSHPPATVLMVAGTARDEIEPRLNGYALAPSAWLTKPAVPSSLLDACQVALGRSVRPVRRNEQADAALQAHQAQLRGARVLVVEDNAVNQEIARELLSRAGLVVAVADDGQQALDRVARETFDAVLMDCEMPVMDGYTAAGLLRLRDPEHHLPIIAMTANAMAGDRERALGTGMDDYIGKPIRVPEMFATLARWIPPQGQRPTDRTAAVEPMPALACPGLDPHAWHELGLGDAHLYRRLLALFLQTYRAFPAPLDACLQRGDTHALADQVHGLKSAAASLGASGVAAAAEHLERACGAGADAVKQAALLDRLSAQLRPVLEGLEQLMAQGALSPD